MATAIFRQDGNAIDYTPSTAVAAGDIVILEGLFGVAKQAIAAGELGALSLVGVYTLPKDVGVGTAIAKGVKVYWDESEGYITTTSTDNLEIGHTFAASVDADATAPVRLNQ